LKNILKFLLIILILLGYTLLGAIEKSDKAPFKGHITFDHIKSERFSTFSEKNTTLKNGILWTRGKGGKKYPPMVRFPIKEKDCTISFRYRFLGENNSIWMFINGDDSFGGYDHILRVKLLSTGVAISVDAHTKDPKQLKVKKGKKQRKPDKLSGAYRMSEKLPMEKVNLKDNKWHELTLVFKDNTVSMSLDEKLWTKELTRPGFGFEKQGINWMLNGGEKGIEIDDLKVISKAPIKTENIK